MRFSLLLILSCFLVGGSLPVQAQEEKPRIPALSKDQAWKRLPRSNPSLPVWARILSESLPVTTAKMLELDYRHRTSNPLPPQLRAKLRWQAAKTIGCDYSAAVAIADLERTGCSKEAMLAFVVGEDQRLAKKEQLALAFAKKMTRAAHEITDNEVAELLDVFGAEMVVAMVHTLAHANFQDRIFLALGIRAGESDLLPPQKYSFDYQNQVKVAKRPPWSKLIQSKSKQDITTSPWQKRTEQEVIQSMLQQKQRKPRIPLPDEKRLANLPPPLRQRSQKIVWSHVSMGYQPQLTMAWFDTMGTLQREIDLDRVFSQLYFWVVTNSNECFY